MLTTIRAGACSRGALPEYQNEGDGGTDGLNIEENLPQFLFEEVDDVAIILVHAAKSEDNALQNELWTPLTDGNRPNLGSTIEKDVEVSAFMHAESPPAKPQIQKIPVLVGCYPSLPGIYRVITQTEGSGGNMALAR
jgi:hypothetical protein